jgi:hypothetical protein
MTLIRGPTACGQPSRPDDTNTPDGHTEQHNTTPTSPRRRLTRLTIAELRRLFNLIGKDDQAIDQGLHWSTWRREHQADARAHHFRRRLRLQVMQI